MNADGVFQLSPRALQDLKEIALSLEKFQEGLGARFVRQAHAALENLAQFPALGAPREMIGADLHSICTRFALCPSNATAPIAFGIDHSPRTKVFTCYAF